MKKHFSAFILLTASITILCANEHTTSSFSSELTAAIARVESARDDTVKALKSMVSIVDTARSLGTESNNSISTQIIETHALSQIAKSTAAVEIAKAKAMTLITQAIDKLDPNSLAIISDAVASVELAKEAAKKVIVTATGRVEISKTKQKEIMHPQETLTIAKNVSAIQIAKSVAQTEVAKAVSLIEVAKSSFTSTMEGKLPIITQQDKDELAQIKAKATANISSYLAKIEVMKANMLSKIAQEVAKVEIAKLKVLGVSSQHEKNSTTYPNTLIKAN